MKILKFILLVAALATINMACDKDEITSTYNYQAYVPIYKSAEELAPEITYESNRELKNPGKIYYYGNYILINEKLEGVHIIDNTDITSPQKVGFIGIEGNIDIALRENFLYADDYYNLLVIDISDIENPKLENTIPNIKEEIYFDDVVGGFLVDYQLLEREVKVIDGEEIPYEVEFEGIIYYNTDFYRTLEVDFLADAAIPTSAAGGGGSLARMTFIKDHFYYVNNFAMKVFNIDELRKPDLLNTVYLDWGVETIFPYEDYLFIGANDGMHILDNTDPSNPEYISTFRHARACDPVVVQDDKAYVTLRDGSECQNFVNQLDVVDISDLRDPQLIASFPMENPHGLSVRDEILYLCEGEGGLKVFNISNVEVIHENLLAHIDAVFAYDVISISKDLLLMVGNDGFYQFDTSDPAEPKLLSGIRIGE